ncbi:MAG TPA: DUF2023 family protein [Kiritimatiellia bacterium]|nr:DUF2023 family protein [Kiritimatiellia bacterium]HMO98378.1 DUF2023 family protein [Kiritimatiellia bacterium]HMP96764.1 DUF2023 family protein [Kiritimatiellia bacterium]
MDVFYHLLYEHSRGLRDLALYTILPDQQGVVEEECLREGVAYWLRPIEDGRINVYFGHPSCVDVVKSFGGCPHCKLTPEQDFMLGIMLGYDRTRQCERYLGRQRQCLEQRQVCPVNQAPVHCIREPDAEHSLV